MRAEQSFCIFTTYKPKVKSWYQYNQLKAPGSLTIDHSNAAILVLFVLGMAFWLFATGFVFVFRPVRYLIVVFSGSCGVLLWSVACFLFALRFGVICGLCSGSYLLTILFLKREQDDWATFTFYLKLLDEWQTVQRLIWSDTVCPGLFAPIFVVNMVLTLDLFP